MAKGVPTSTYSNHNVASKDSHEYQHFRVSDSIFPFGNANHRELSGACAPFYQITNLKYKDSNVLLKILGEL